MSTIQWEYEIVEKPFCEQLSAMGWQWIEGDPDLPETTERDSSREVLLRARLAAALRRINRRDGQPWLDDARIAKAIRDLEQAAGHRLMEVNQAATQLLLKGTVTEGLPDWIMAARSRCAISTGRTPTATTFWLSISSKWN